MSEVEHLQALTVRAVEVRSYIMVSEFVNSRELRQEMLDHYALVSSKDFVTQNKFNHEDRSFKEILDMLENSYKLIKDENRILTEHGGRARKDYEQNATVLATDNEDLQKTVKALAHKLEVSEAEVHTLKRLREFET